MFRFHVQKLHFLLENGHFSSKIEISFENGHLNLKIKILLENGHFSLENGYIKFRVYSLNDFFVKFLQKTAILIRKSFLNTIFDRKLNDFKIEKTQKLD